MSVYTCEVLIQKMASFLYQAWKGRPNSNQADTGDNAPPIEQALWESLRLKESALIDDHSNTNALQWLKSACDWHRDHDHLQSQDNAQKLNNWLCARPMQTESSLAKADPSWPMLAAEMYHARQTSRKLLLEMPAAIIELFKSPISIFTLSRTDCASPVSNSSSPLSPLARRRRFINAEAQSLLNTLLTDMIGFVLAKHAEWVNEDLEAMRVYSGKTVP